MNDLASAIAATNALVDYITDGATPSTNPSMPVNQALATLANAAMGLAKLAPSRDMAGLNAAAKGLHSNLMDLIHAAKMAANQNEEDVSLLDGVKALSDALAALYQVKISIFVVFFFFFLDSIFTFFGARRLPM